MSSMEVRFMVMLMLPLFMMERLIAQERRPVSLAGEWQFRLDSARQGESDGWYRQSFTETVNLPGTTDENKKGYRNGNLTTSNLVRLYEYEGPAWYQKEIDIPEEWNDKVISLLLERTKQTKVWLDDHLLGTQKSLSTAQVFDLTPYASKGKHRLTIQVDNTLSLFPMRLTHALSDRIQTNWNGIIGRMELSATDRLFLGDVQVYPDVKDHLLTVKVTAHNDTKQDLKAELNVGLEGRKIDPEKKIIFEAIKGETVTTFRYPLPGQVKCWDEFTPNLYDLTVSLKASEAGANYSDTKRLKVGLRSFTTVKKQFAINGRTILLRGKHDAGVFPLTGYCAMDVKGWERVLTVAKAFGINYYRFHSWCPPEAAFEAADKIGIYLQPELPVWAKMDGGQQLLSYLTNEGNRILEDYGNHPSFVMFSMGNELGGPYAGINTMLNSLMKKDPRHLFAAGSNNAWNDPQANKDGQYISTSSTYREGGSVVTRVDLVRGSMIHDYLGHINNAYPPSTTTDYTRAIASADVPVLAHELGQYSMFPDIDELSKYTGVLRPYALETFKKRLEAKHMLNQAHDFFRASGELAAICYREDIEANLRTKGMAGFALLDLQDYPGTGTAYVGMVDAFMDPKGIIVPEKWRQFCSATVPLLLIPKRTWTDRETIHARVKLANYSTTPFAGKQMIVTLSDSSGKQMAVRTLAIPALAGEGGLIEIGDCSFALNGFQTPQKANLKLQVKGTAIQNNYAIWIYPTEIRHPIPDDLILSRQLDSATLKRLNAGASVLLLPDLFDLGKSERGQFITNFWTVPYFITSKPPGTLGILVDPSHPVFKDFPTDDHSDWQWWPLTKYARPVILDDMPSGLTPLVQVIDNYETDRKLGLLFEAAVGKGKLMFCAIDVLNNRDKPEVRQLLYSILHYMESDRFSPKVSVTTAQLLDLFKAPRDADLPPGYSLQKDIVYKETGNWAGTMDIFLPPPGKSPVTLIVHIHGGAWKFGKKESQVPYFDPFFKSGYAVANVEYRLTDKAPAPAAIEDVRCALIYLFNNADRWNINPSKIVVSGYSAGGHLALMAGLLGNDTIFNGGCVSHVPVKVAAIIDRFGIADVTNSSHGDRKREWAVAWLGNRVDDLAFTQSVSPISYVKKTSPPVLIIHGDRDSVVPYQQSIQLYNKLKSVGVKTELITVTGFGHQNFPKENTDSINKETAIFLKDLGL